MKFMEILEDNFQRIKEYTNPESYILTPRAFSMNPIWSFNVFLIFILANKGKSLTMEIENFVEKFFDDDEEKLITKQNVSKQRKKIFLYGI